MNEHQKSLLYSTSLLFPPPKGVKFSYGTAGFRADASLLLSTVYRVGILAALRAVKTGAVIGLMITASHNKVTDNGVKVADPSGGMLTKEWEPFADEIANAGGADELVRVINVFVRKENIDFEGVRPAEILLARDTRPSGVSLIDAAKQVVNLFLIFQKLISVNYFLRGCITLCFLFHGKGINSIIGAIANDFGILTTPQLHWMVHARNKGFKATEQDYFEQLVTSYRCLVDLTPVNSNSKVDDDILVIDGANGVGGEKLELLKGFCDGLSIKIRNSGKDGGVLNEGVGADFVQKEKVAPSGFGANDVGLRCASLDGDADRLVYFSVPQGGGNKIDLVDGDKILSLFALFIKEQLTTLLRDTDGRTNSHDHACLGIVQTAYANGASTHYLRNIGLDVFFTPTGVKYLHEKAAEYDIGIYFEANGHGTILFSEDFCSWLESRNSELASASEDSEKRKAALRLLAVSRLINQAVGDALSGLLLVEVILKHMGWSIQKWNQLYTDLPSKQLKVKVADRNAVVTTNAETIAVKPTGIQEAIDAEVAKYPQGRSFIRPSGTEDVLRVYAEAATQEAADSLAESVAALVNKFVGHAD